MEYIEGKRPVLEALREGVPVRCVLVADNLKRDGLVSDALRKARARDIPVQEVPRKRLDEKSARGSHQGIMAEAEDFRYADLSEVCAAAQRQAEAQGGSALVAVLDHLTDAGNLGAVARSAESVGAAGLVIPNKRAAQVTAAAYKSSAGAVARIPVARVANLTSALERLKREGFWVAAASEHAADVIWEANLKGKIALVMGNEREGISRLVLQNCDFGVKLPQVGTIESLNVAQSFTACAYEWLRQNWDVR